MDGAYQQSLFAFIRYECQKEIAMPLFNAHPNNRVHVFIDGQNVYGTLKSIRKKLDYKRFMDTLKEETRLIRVNYFTTIRENADDQFFGVLDFLEEIGYNVETKEIRDHMDESGFVRVRGTMIGEMTASMVLSANRADHIILFSGDGELQAAVNASKRQDARVTVVSHEDVLSDDLRRSCDDFYPIVDLPEDILVREDARFRR